MPKYQVNEIFHSLQGEGFNTGRPVVFIRLSNCNLSCIWCDTNYHDYSSMSLEDILSTVSLFGVNSVIITGGEPTIHENFFELAQALKNKGYWLALETNGTSAMAEETAALFDYIVISPKSFYARLYEKPDILSKANEVRVIVDSDVFNFCEFIEQRITSDVYYLSPCAKMDNTFNVLESIGLLGKLNMRESGKKWFLSFQTHKFANIQ